MTSLAYSFILLVIALEMADVETLRCRIPGACPPLPEMLAFDLPGVPGVGRRVASSGEAGGHQAWPASACRFLSITYSGFYYR